MTSSLYESYVANMCHHVKVTLTFTLTLTFTPQQERFSAALDYFRQEQREKGKRPVISHYTATINMNIMSHSDLGSLQLNF